MENENNNTVTQPVENTIKTEETVTQPVDKTEVKQEEKTFTQEQVNAMLAKEKSKMPSKEELKAFNEWKESQKTEEQKKKEDIIARQNLETENNFKSQMLEIMKKGVSYDDAEFIQFKVSKMEGEFNDNLDEFLNQNTKYTMKEKEEKKPTTTGFSQNNSNQTISDGKAYLDKKYANNPYYKK